jgi:Kef-type K+ transport system membrane component KefB
MEQVWFTAALWLLLALIAVLAAHWTGVSTALSEIVVGTVAQSVIGTALGREVLDTMLALGFLFAPSTWKALLFAVLCALVLFALPMFTRWFFERFGGRVSEMETKYLLFPLFGMGGVAAWAGSEAVLPAYLIGMMLAGTVGRGHFLVRRLRTLTFGLLTPFHFIRAGSFVSVTALLGAPLVFSSLFGAKMVSRLAGLLPVVRAFGHARKKGTYDSVMMSTGLTSGTISALFGLNHSLISQVQYSHPVAAVIGSAVVPTAIASARATCRCTCCRKKSGACASPLAESRKERMDKTRPAQRQEAPC